MTRSDKLISAAEAAALVGDGTHLATCGFSMMGACESVLKAIEQRFLDTGTPRNLALLHAAGQSDRTNGIEHLAHPGLLGRVVGAHWGLAPKIGGLIHDNAIEAHCLPQGQLTHLFRAMAGGKSGNASRIGLGTFIDPRLEGGMMNDRARAAGPQVAVVDLLGEEHLYYKAQRIDVALIRGTRCDTDGNLTTTDEAVKLETLAVAQAAKARGGIVIAQVREFVPAGTLPARDITVPGICVDRIVVCDAPETDHRQTASAYFEPAYIGAKADHAKGSAADPIPENLRKHIARRGCAELFDGAVVNLGTGIPGDAVGPVAAELGLLDRIHLTVESGLIGGVPLGNPDFGVALAPDAIIGHDRQFDYYNGAGVDITFMGAAEIDRRGNVNVSKFGTAAVGCGGFIDITQGAKKVVFLTTYTAGGLDASFDADGRLTIHREGRFPKFVDTVGQVTFSADQALANGQDVLYITERCVFRLTPEGLDRIETTPGVDPSTL